MIRALAAEWRKLTTTRMWWGLGLVLVGYVGFVAALFAGLFGAVATGLIGPDAANTGGAAIPEQVLPPLVYSTVTAVGYVIPLVLGTLTVTGEVRHRTLTPTFLAVPSRPAVLGAKLVVAAVAGALLGVAGLVVSIGVGGGILAALGIDPQLGEADTWWLAARAVLAMAIWAAVGVGVGSLIQSQIAAVIVVIAFTQFVEPILRTGAAFWEPAAQVGRFLPGAASDALVGASVYATIATGPVSVEPLTWWQGGLVLVAYAAVAAVVGWATTWRRDVT